MAELSDQEMLRYNRQIILRGFDFEGQEALKDARVLVVGLGGLGCAATQYLAGAGVGQLTLLDFDTVSVSISSVKPCTATPRSGSQRLSPPATRWRESTRILPLRPLTRGWTTTL